MHVCTSSDGLDFIFLTLFVFLTIYQLPFACLSVLSLNLTLIQPNLYKHLSQ